MIALVIGLIIVLGAGQLFLTGFQSFKKIEILSIKQSALTFAADVLLRDIRRAERNSIVLEGSTLTMNVDGASVEYGMTEGGQGWSLSKDGEPVVDGFKDAASFEVKGLGVGIYEVTFDLVEENAKVVFHAVNRTEAIN
ncbi:MAG TPA: hypothetical protein VLO13_01600 [Halomonas sp.]|nr:hypothetical protein [Halomonas sp.]